MNRMKEYKDDYFKKLTMMVRNVGAFRSIPAHNIRDIVYKLKEHKYRAGEIII